MESGYIAVLQNLHLMENVFQILAVFGLLMLVITYSVQARDRRFREYYFSRQIILPFPGAPDWDILSAAAAAEEGRGFRSADPENELSFSPGEGAELIVADYTTGRTVTTIFLGGDADDILFDPATKLIYCCSGEGYLIIIRQAGRDAYKIMQRLVIPKGCRSLVLDPHTGSLFLPRADSVFVYANR